MGNSIMTALVINGDTSGSITLQVPAAAGAGTVQTLPAATGTVMVSGNQPSFSTSMSTNPVCSHNTYTKLPFDTESWDTASCFNTSTYRFTPNVAGYYQFNLYIRNGGGAGRQYDNVLFIYKNGSGATYVENSFAMGSGQVTNLTTSATLYANGSTDYFEVYFYVYDYTASSTVTVYGGQCLFQATLIRAA
jgi:hypothetical protein